MQESLPEVQGFRELTKDTGERGLSLDLTDKTYESFPCAILELTELRVLKLNYSNLSSIPSSINRLINLEVLELRGNELKEFPSVICELTRLEILDLSENEIVSISSDIGKLTALKTLKLLKTKLEGNLSEHLSTLTSLVDLDVSKNALDFIPDSFTNLKKLERLNMWRNCFRDAPLVLTALTKLKTLDISYNKLEAFNLDLSGLKQLKDLDLEGNSLISFPEKVCSLVSLQRLDVGRNKITDVPDNIRNLSKLKELWINHNNLESFPNVICKLKSLEMLSICYNNIESIPNEVAYLANLKILELDSCGLDNMPLSICMLKNLKWLSLGNNNITKIPIVLTSLHELSYINLVGNKHLKMPPLSIIKRGINAIFNYLNETDIKKTIYQKLIFLGNVGAGKSSLSKTLIQGSPQLSDERDRTLLLDEMSWTPEENLSLQVYDFGGSAWYDVVQHFFIDKHSIIFLVVSLVGFSEDAYIDSIENWLQIIQARAPGAHLFVAATHSDLLNDEEVVAKQTTILEMMKSREKLQVEYVEKEIKRLENLGHEGKTARESLKKSLGNRLVLPEKVYSVSSKNLQNIVELKKDLLQKAKELGRVIPSSWHQLYHSLHTSELSKTKQYLTYKDVTQMDLPGYSESPYPMQGTVHYSPAITIKRSPLLETQQSMHVRRATSITVSKAIRVRKRSEQTRPSAAELLKKNPIENDEQRRKKTPAARFQVQRLDEESERSVKDDRLQDILAFFHSIGDVIWYEGNPEIKNFVFHKQSFLIELLKRIFSERPDELKVGHSVLIKQGLSTKALEAAREDLRTRGIMSLNLLKSLLDDLKLEGSMVEAIMQLLVHFDLCYKLQDEVQTNQITKLHFPWFLRESVPKEANDMLSTPAPGNRRLILEYEFPLGCPLTLYDFTAVHIHRVVPDYGSIEHWKNGVYARIRDSKVMLHRTFDEVRMITISFHVEGRSRDLNHLWDILANLHKEYRIMMTNWPGILHEKWLVCPHCTSEGLQEPHRFDGQNIEKCCPKNEEMFTCPNAKEKGTIPANLIFPVQASSDVPSDKQISRIAYFVGSDWRQLGRELELGEYVLDQVNAFDQLYEKAYQMLQRWKRGRGSEAHFACLKKALESEGLNRNDVVKDIDKLTLEEE